MGLRYALQVGLSAEQVRSVASGQIERLLSGDEPLELGPSPGPDSLVRDPLLDRVHASLINAIGQMFNGVEPTEVLELARLACDVGDDTPQAPVCRWIVALIEERARYVASTNDRPSRFAPGLHLIVVAAGLSRTPDVPLPPEPVPVDVGERSAAS
jgi:hypothetical protein